MLKFILLVLTVAGMMICRGAEGGAAHQSHLDEEDPEMEIETEGQPSKPRGSRSVAQQMFVPSVDEEKCKQQYGLSDSQVQQFLLDGYLTLESDPGLTSEFHDGMWTAVNELFDREGNHGNNILPRLPGLQRVFSCPTVAAALTALLGHNYIMHPHRHAHQSVYGREAQKIHMDSYWGHSYHRHHRPRMVMAMYYPQKTTLLLGPTAVVPGSQYLSREAEKNKQLGNNVPYEWASKEISLTCNAGTVVIIHYDLWHRATAHQGPFDRFMFKFQFMRMEEPQEPTWNFESLDWRIPQPMLEPFQLDVDELTENLEHPIKDLVNEVIEQGAFDTMEIYEGVTYLQLTKAKPKYIGMLVKEALDNLKAARSDVNSLSTKEKEKLKTVLEDASSRLVNHYNQQLRAQTYYNDRIFICKSIWKWMCGVKESGQEEIMPDEDLIDDLHSQYDSTSLPAAYQLGSFGKSGIDVLLEGLFESDNPQLRRNCMYGLSVAGQAAVPSLLKELSDKNHHGKDLARIAFALGEIGDLGQDSVEALFTSFEDEEEYLRWTAVEALGGVQQLDDSSLHKICRLLTDSLAQVRFTACLTLIKYAHGGAPNAPLMLPYLSLALGDSNRYVQGYAVEALRCLHKSGCTEATDLLIETLMISRWCPITSTSSTF